ncbi:MAG TPA: DUF1015 domain-containing protein [Planctomycetes bacterium]|nr:DUF1015 domain-containing protein [Planctomycetota bacterium]
MEIKPFKAFRFDPGAVGDVGRCISPPYDVISPTQQQQLYEKSKYNIVRIIKGKTTSFDNDDNNQYTRAADYLKTWVEKGVLRQDSTESIYAYVQDFELDNPAQRLCRTVPDSQTAIQLKRRSFQRFSFIALARIEDLGKAVRDHENTFNGPIIDRLNLIEATGAKFGLPFMLYEDAQNIADDIIESAVDNRPLIDFLDEQDVRHRLFAITAKDGIEAISEMMQDKSCIIADGHHRYQTALRYLKETSNPKTAYQMTAFANTRHEGLIVLATHRLVGNLKNFDLRKLLADIKEDFEVAKFEFGSPHAKTAAKQKMLAQMKAEHNRDKNVFGVYGGNCSFYTAVLKNKQAMDSAAHERSRSWCLLDVAVLHKLVLEKLLGIDGKKLASGSNVEYIKGTGSAIDEAIAKVDGRQKQVALFMNPIKMQQLKTITDVGEKMPQKSTFFYPKVFTGLTINKL